MRRGVSKRFLGRWFYLYKWNYKNWRVQVDLELKPFRFLWRLDLGHYSIFMS